jgi:hypothetical protein
VDVIGISCYCEYIGMPHAWVRYKLQQSGAHGVALAGKTLGRNYLAGQKTLIAVLYCATNSNYPGVIPTPQQSYHDVWSAIVSGAQGISVFAYWHALHDTPALANNLQQFNLAASQITGAEQLGSVVLYGTPNPNVTFTVTSGPTQTVAFQPPSETSSFQYPSLNVLSRTWSGNVYVIGVNSTDQSVSASFTNVPTAAAAAVLPFESRSLPVSAGGFVDTFPPWGVHIYKMPASPRVSVFSHSSGGFCQFAVTNSGVSAYTVLTSTNLVDWAVSGSATQVSSGLYELTNADLSASPWRYYRLRWP